MGPNDAELVRVWTREVGGAIGDVTFAYDANCEVVVDVEAGKAIHELGARYEVGIVVRDLEAHNNIQATPASFKGAMQDDRWPTQANQFVFTIAAPGKDRLNHCCEVIAFLSVGAAAPDVSFARSPMFIITHP